MQRRIVFIVNAICKCPANLTLSTSLPVELFHTTRATIYLRDRQRFALLDWPVYRGGGEGGCVAARHTTQSLWVFALDAWGDVKREGHTPPILSKRSFLCFSFQGCVRARARACADTGIFALAKQGSRIDLCDCDEFGIVI